MAINENVYGLRENWYVPVTHTENGGTITGKVSYYGNVNNDNTLKVKVANYNTLNTPITTIGTQMSGHPNTYVINNNWDPTSMTTTDVSICQFGVGSQSGLSNIDWYGINWAAGTTQPETGSHNDVKIINQDKYEICNIGFALGSEFRPPLLATAGGMAGNGDMDKGNHQTISYQMWGDERCYYALNESSYTGYLPASAYAYCQLITQIPIKNLKIYPRILAFKNDGTYQQYDGISDYLQHKNEYPFIGCISAEFYYASTTVGNFDAKVNITPWFLNETEICKNYYSNVLLRDKNILYLRNIDSEYYTFVLGGVPLFSSQSYYGVNGIFWHYNTSSFNYDKAEVRPVYQPKNLPFVYNNTLNIFACDVSQMSDNDLTENIRVQLASFGLFFVDNFSDRNLALDNNKTFLGILKNGVGYGDYSHGADNRQQPQWNWDSMEENDYDPDNPPTPPSVDPNTYGIGMHTNAPWMSSPNRLYSINSTWISSIVSLYNSLWKCYYDNNVGMEEGQTPPTEFNFNEFLTVSPIDTIVSLKLFPYDTKSSTTNVGIRLGKYATGVNAYNALLYNVLDFGTVAIYPYFGDNWKDRETKYTLYAPFCGTLELDPAFYMGHTVGLEYWIDQVTGACTAALYITDNDNAKVYGDTVSGICAVDVPITGLDQATIQSQIFNANQQLKNANVNAASGLANAAMGIVASAAMGNAVGAATSAISGISNLIKNTNAVEAASYNLQHNKMSPRMIGAASPLCSMLGDWIPRIIVSIPIDPLSDAEQQQFSEIKGYSCIIPDKIGNHSGYVQAVNLKIVPPDQAAAAPTEEEVELIKSLVASGIYI